MFEHLKERERFAGLVRELRGEKSLRKFAKELEVSASSVGAWENCESVPQLEQIQKIAKLKSWSVPKLFYYVEGKQPSEKDLQELSALTKELGDGYFDLNPS